jgi:hypothetical protein
MFILTFTPFSEDTRKAAPFTHLGGLGNAARDRMKCAANQEPFLYFHRIETSVNLVLS